MLLMGNVQVQTDLLEYKNRRYYTIVQIYQTKNLFENHQVRLAKEVSDAKAAQMRPK
jgi:UDP-N-acetylglucosamine transferase subunit ALG13